ncbi:MAG: signal recognition particle-docking protein FtsY [Bdellovibrionaceae bacterium]|jgi:fused signal recognition particle receptor|nr:signal recognition particle-docking protein FtsY [Pseudobdellovibrionaceae bacterium]
MLGQVQYLPLIFGLITGVILVIGFYKFRKKKELPAKDKKQIDEVAREIIAKNRQADLGLVARELPAHKKEKQEAKVPLKSERKDLKEALRGTKANLFGRIQNVFTSKDSLTDEDMENLEEILYTSDLGPGTVQRLLESVNDKFEKKEISDFTGVCNALKSEMLHIFQINKESDYEELFNIGNHGKTKPQVWMIVGVNGAGKTTTIGKLANTLSKKDLKIMVAAGDTFRAAAGDQLKVWSERANVEIFFPENIKDPSAVAYDACEKAKAQGIDVLIIDTAGRLHTQDNLMEELKKMKRVIQKVIPEGPHETLLVLDSNSGQNALIQADKFHTALDVSGVVLTKLDGSAKGGVAVGLACEYSLPIKMIGVGEGIDDLRPFNSQEFVDSIL